MNQDLQALILRILNEHRIMTIATNRSDGWPQATIVGYVNDGMRLYTFVARLSQKFTNITRDPRVSVAIGNDFDDPLKIVGLSLAGKARPVEDKSEYDRVCDLFLKRYPEYASWPKPDPTIAPMIRIAPEIVSVLDYSKGFGHSDLVKLDAADGVNPAEPRRHSWFSWRHG
jgi:nitroimidazol reductase NimA-like FMN-containing flavoprotein (pyridoxamine 5'-phosphate oxidase superfamily)